MVTGPAASVMRFVDYHNETGAVVETFTFGTTPGEEAAIVQRIEEHGGESPGFCAAGTSSVLSGIGPFRDLPLFMLPGSLADALRPGPLDALRIWFGSGPFWAPPSKVYKP